MEGRSRSLERENRELAILNDIATSLNETLDLSASLRGVLSQVADLLDLTSGWVWLLDESNGTPYLAASQNLPPGLKERPEAMEGSCYCLDTFRSGDLKGAANINVVGCSRLRGLAEGTDGLRYHASIPLTVRGEKLGVMNVASPEWRRLEAEDLRILHTIGEMLAAAVERARLYRKSVESGAVEERNRLAREIHDSLAQDLSGTVFQLETADALLTQYGKGTGEREVGTVPAIHDAVREALRGTRKSLEEARRSVLDLRATPLEGRSLFEAVERLVGASRTASGPEIRCRPVGAARPLPARVEVGLFRIIQESLANALQHARASSIDVELTATPESVQVVVSDDGVGLESDSLAGRFGLIGMRERAHLLGGDVSLESEAGVGTRVEVSIPLDT